MTEGHAKELKEFKAACEENKKISFPNWQEDIIKSYEAKKPPETFEGQLWKKYRDDLTKGIEWTTSELNQKERRPRSMATLPNNEREFLAGLSERTRILIPDDVFYASCDKTVAIPGAGGIGGMVIEMLARWGIKRFRIADKDKFELSNLNRQVLATVNELGQWKAEVAAKRIKAINPYADVELVINEKLSPKNISQFADGADILINMTDSRSCYILLDNAARTRRIPLVFGHGSYGEGRGPGGMKIYVFDYRKPDQRGLENPFKLKVLNQLRNKYTRATVKDIEKMTEAELDELDRHPIWGVVGFTVNLCACYVVAEVIKLLTGLGKVNLYPKETVLDIFESTIDVRNKYSPIYVFRQLRDHKR
jgi:molybdopterin/thiamine biosynthesis adenylyltransferase